MLYMFSTFSSKPKETGAVPWREKNSLDPAAGQNLTTAVNL
jgi:hypothetical protein